MSTQPSKSQRRRRQRRRTVEEHPYVNQQLLWDTRWTPNTEELQSLIAYAAVEAGSISALSRAIGLKVRHVRRVLNGESKAVSFRVVDQILARSGVAHRIQSLPWLTVDDLVEQGIWKPQKRFVPKWRQ